MRYLILPILFLLITCGRTDTMTSAPLPQADPVDGDQQDQPVQVAPQANGETGLDMNGQRRTCKDISAEVNCTMVFTPSDQYANDCRNRGNKAVMCGCHDWICVENN